MLTFKTLEKHYLLGSKLETPATKGILISLVGVKLRWKFLGLKYYDVYPPRYYFKANNETLISSKLQNTRGKYVMNWMEINAPFNNFDANVYNLKIKEVIDVQSNLHSVLEFKSKISISN